MNTYDGSPRREKTKTSIFQRDVKTIQKRTSLFGIGVAQSVLGTSTLSFSVTSTTLWLQKDFNHSLTTADVQPIIFDYTQAVWSSFLLVITGVLGILISKKISVRLISAYIACSLISSVLLITLFGIQIATLVINNLNTTQVLFRTMTSLTALAGIVLCGFGIWTSCKITISNGKKLTNRVTDTEARFSDHLRSSKLPLHGLYATTLGTPQKRLGFREAEQEEVYHDEL